MASTNDSYAYTESTNQSVSYTANGRNQYSTVSNLSPAPVYDARGNLTSASGFTGSYSLENLLTTAGAFTLDYDPGMRLYQIDSASTSAIRFQYDGADMVGEYNSSDVLQRRFVHGPGADEPLVWYEGSGTSDRRFLHADERGSIIAISNSAGTSIGTNAYDEYGVPAASNTGRFQYTGQEYLSEIGVSYYKARMYAPALGRFLQSDPIGYSDGLNLYAYAGNDPINSRDPGGNRKMTSQEISDARSIFGNRINYSQVNVQIGGFRPLVPAIANYEGHAITLENNIYFSRYEYSIPVLIHELTHVWQFQTDQQDPLSLGINLLRYGDSAYNVDYSKGFDDQNPEAQGDITEGCYNSDAKMCAVLSTNSSGLGSLGLYTVSDSNRNSISGLFSSGSLGYTMSVGDSATITTSGGLQVTVTVNSDGSYTYSGDITGTRITKYTVKPKSH